MSDSEFFGKVIGVVLMIIGLAYMVEALANLYYMLRRYVDDKRRGNANRD